MTPTELPEPPGAGQPAPDPLGRFRNWHGFLFLAIALNALFVWGMVAVASNPEGGIWIKVLSWLPFNVIASVLYLVILLKLSRHPGRIFYAALCVAMIALNWLIFLRT